MRFKKKQLKKNHHLILLHTFTYYLFFKCFLTWYKCSIFNIKPAITQACNSSLLLKLIVNIFLTSLYFKKPIHIYFFNILQIIFRSIGVYQSLSSDYLSIMTKNWLYKYQELVLLIGFIFVIIRVISTKRLFLKRMSSKKNRVINKLPPDYPFEK